MEKHTGDYIMDYARLQDEVFSIIVDFVQKSSLVKAIDCGLDDRAGWEIYISPNKDVLFVHQNRVRDLRYYGGFEYVDDMYICTIGDYVFFEDSDSRVAAAIESVIESGILAN